MKKILNLGLFSVCCLFACSSLQKVPEETYYQFHHSSSYEIINDSIIFQIENPLLCPLRISLSSNKPDLSHIVQQFGVITLREKSDTLLRFPLAGMDKVSFNFKTAFGDVNMPIMNKPVALPFLKGKNYMILQGYNGDFSHSGNYSRYALDFDLKSNDTICSVDYGFVVGVIKDYKYGGSTAEWRNNDKSNFITIYHPNTGLFSQYVHLIHNGSLVKIGDTVHKGTPIGLSGRTGFAAGDHLHFNMLKPDAETSLISTEIEFDNGYKGSELNNGTYISNNSL